MHAREAAAPYQRNRADEVLAWEVPWRARTGPTSAAGRRRAALRLEAPCRCGKFRRASFEPGAEACSGGITTGLGAARQAQKGVFWAWRHCEASERMTLVLTLSFYTIGLGRRAKGAKSANSHEVPLGRCS